MLIAWFCLLGAIFLVGTYFFASQRVLIGALIMSACVATAFLILFMWAAGSRW